MVKLHKSKCEYFVKVMIDYFGKKVYDYFVRNGFSYTIHKECAFMKKTAKLISVLLAVLMAFSVLPLVAFAGTTENASAGSDSRLAAWKENYQFLIDTVLDDTNFTSYNYVDINKKAMQNEMNAYTAFALYDNAWRNYATKEINVENAKKILLALIDEAQFDINDGYVDEFVKVLEGASDFNDFLQKLNKYLKNDTIASAEWSEVFKYLNIAIDVANAYQNYRDKLIEAYARVLAVRQANGTYIEFLGYIADNAQNASLAAAAKYLRDTMNDTLEDQLKLIVAEIAKDGATVGVNYVLDIAVNSNVYSAAVVKVYGIGKKAADFLWNTSAMYEVLDSLKCAYEFQTLAADWAEAKLDGEDADTAVYAFGIALTARDISEDTLFALKKAESDGVVGKIKNKLYGTVYNDIEVSKASLALIKDVMFAKELDGAKKVVTGLNIFCPVNVDITTKLNAKLYTLADGAEATAVNEYGAFASVYSEYSKEYLKVAFLFDDYRVKLTGTAEGYVTLKMDVLEADGTINDWSFTDVKVDKGDTMVFDTTAVEAPFYTFGKKDGGIEKINFNDKFVESEQKEVTAKDVIDATVDVGKEEAKSFADKIKEFFKKLFENIFKIFKKK